MFKEYLTALDECENLNAVAFKQRLRLTRLNFRPSDDFRGLLGTYAYSTYPGTPVENRAASFHCLL